MWRVWFQMFDERNRLVGIGVLSNEYVRKGNALRKAQSFFSPDKFGSSHIKWFVSQSNPFEAFLRGDDYAENNVC